MLENTTSAASQSSGRTPFVSQKYVFPGAHRALWCAIRIPDGAMTPR
jgi:hypothetical protein